MMKPLLYAELLKLHTTIAVKLLAVCTIALSALGIVMTGTFADGASRSLDAEAQLGWFNLAGASVFAMILGILIGTTDQRHGTIVPTLLAAPSRLRLVLAKALATLVAATALVAVVAATTAVAVPSTLRFIDRPMEARWGAVIELWGLGTLALLASALIGLGLGLLVARQAGALVIGLVVTFVVTPLVVGFAPDIGRFLPGMLELTLTDGSAGMAGATSSAAQLGRAISALLLTAWAAALLLPAATRFSRTDVAA